MPANAEQQPVPAILEYLPYRKRDGTVVRDEMTHPWFAGHGYACIRVDMRGNGESEGLMLDEYTSQELSDACEVIAWLSSQAWCTGNVGMMGISWGGFNSLQVAALQPPALKAIITLCSTVDRYADDIHYKGGCLLNENIGWAATMLSYSSRPPDPQLVGNAWHDMWLERLENMPFLASTWLRHQHRDAYWQHGSVCENYAAIDAAVLAVGGWHDGYRNTVSHLVEHITAPVKGIVGPWIHKYPHYAAPQPAIGFLQEAVRWWDRWLKEKNTGVENEPDYRAWLMDSIKPQRWMDARPGMWIGENVWPSPTIETTRLQLVDDGLAANGSLLQSVDVESPQHCGEQSGEYFPFTFGPELPDEQSIDDARSVCFDGESLLRAMDIVGAPSIDLTLSANQTQGMMIVRLCDLRNDGSSALITMGVLNLMHRDSSEDPSPLTIDESVDVQVVLDQIAYRIPTGHRLRVAISTSYWPFVWPAPVAATLTLQAGVLQLPVRPVHATEHVRFDAPESAGGWRSEKRRDAASTRQVVADSSTGIVTTDIINDFGEFKDLEHELVSGSVSQERWHIHPDNPLSARADINWQQTGGRDDWQWSTDVSVRMWCDATHFHVSGKLTARLLGDVAFERDYDDTILREYV